MDIEAINFELQKLVSIDTRMIVDQRYRLYTLLTIINVDIPDNICDNIEQIIFQERLKSISLKEIITTNNSIRLYRDDTTELEQIILQEDPKSVSLKEIIITNNPIHLYRGDITNLEVDMIVNAANPEMLGCFNPSHKCIDNVIHSKAGPRLRMECRNICNGRKNNKTLITKAYCLPSKYIIHIVGPIYDQNKDQSGDLSYCYSVCLEIARKYNLSSIAFCCISTGFYGYPKEKAAKIAISTVRGWLMLTKYPINIIFDVFTEEDYQIYKFLLKSNV